MEICLLPGWVQSSSWLRGTEENWAWTLDFQQGRLPWTDPGSGSDREERPLPALPGIPGQSGDVAVAGGRTVLRFGFEEDNACDEAHRAGGSCQGLMTIWTDLDLF